MEIFRIYKYYTKGTRYYELSLRSEIQAWGVHVTENSIACSEATRRSRDGSMGSVYKDLGSIGSGTPCRSSIVRRSI